MGIYKGVAIMKKKLFAILVCSVMTLNLTGCGKSESKEINKDLQEIQDKYVWVEKETVV